MNVWIKETDEILHLATSDGETIDTTTNHPFYVKDKGWVAAGDLKIGDTLVTANGDEVGVTDVEIEKLAEPILVYNLETEDLHTYFVGEYGVLVHNYDYEVKSLIGSSPALSKEAEKAGKDVKVQKEINELINKFLAGNDNPGKGSKNLFKDVCYLRGENGARVFYRIKGNVMEILGKSSKGNEKKVIQLIKELFGGV